LSQLAHLSMDNTKLFFAPKAFIVKDNKVLIVRESASDPTNTRAGEYSLIGGRINDDEPWQEGFMREVQEEIGAAIKIDKPLFVSESFNKVNGQRWHIVRCFFLCTIKGEDIKLSQEHDDFKWINPSDYSKENIVDNEHGAFVNYLKK